VAFGLLIAATCQLAADDKAKEVWTNPVDPTLPPDFKVQGEYVGEAEGGAKMGCQVIALGGSSFQAVVCPGGLPGDGWDGKNKILMDGKIEGGGTSFRPATGKKEYLAGPPERFSATATFPPEGQKDYSAALVDETLVIKTDDGKMVKLAKTTRKSSTMGAKPPDGAIVLFDGTSADQWSGGRVDKENGILNTDGHDLLSKQKFNDYTAHVEFMIPYRPLARGQGRGNSGFYQVDHYEVQILDSFGLDGKDNECGGVYSKLTPKVNMCYPPLTWQTYDVVFTNAVNDDSGKKVKNARITLKHNGVVVHDDAEIIGRTGGDRNEPEGTPGSFKLQGHGNPLQFRNIWVVEKK
jgi:hypothetical protein